MPTLRVILATPPGFNPGMLVCDAMARAWVSRAGLAGAASFHRLFGSDPRHKGWSQANQERSDLGIDFEPLESPEQLAEATPLYWGDFLHMRQYHLALKRLFPDRAGRIEPLLLLSDSDAVVLERAISFGTTLVFNSAADLMRPYGQSLERFVAGARRVLVRDMASAAQLAALHPAGGPYLGLDAAQLLTLADDLSEIVGDREAPGPPSPSSTAVLFLGRSPLNGDLFRALGRLKARLGLDYHWLPWGDRRAFPRMPDGLPELAAAPEQALPSLAGLLSAVSRARLVVTDTYHLAVISWSLGVPAVTLVSGVTPGKSDVSCGSAMAPLDKRLVFHQQHGLHAFLLDQRAMADPDHLDARIDNMVELIEDGISAWHRRQVRARAGWCEGELVKAVVGAVR